MWKELEGSEQMFGVDLMDVHPFSYVLYQGERVLIHQFTADSRGYRRGQVVSKNSARFLHVELCSVLETRKILFKIFRKKEFKKIYVD